MSLKKGTIDIGTIIKGDASKFSPEFISFSYYMGTTLSLEGLSTSNITDMIGMFSLCSNLTSLDLSSFDTSNVADMSYMFELCQSLTSLDLSSFDTSNVTNMGSMFNECYELTSLDLSSFDTSNVTNMDDMFRACSNLTSIDLSSFDTSNVEDRWGMYDMFNDCSNLKTLIINKNSLLPLKSSASSAFAGCPIYTSTTEGFVYVPNDLVDSYKSATNWSDIANKIKGLSELPQ